MKELEDIYVLYSARLGAYVGSKGTIKGKLEWVQFFKKTETEFFDEIDAACKRLKIDKGLSNEVLKAEANKVAAKFKQHFM